MGNCCSSVNKKNQQNHNSSKNEFTNQNQNNQNGNNNSGGLKRLDTGGLSQKGINRKTTYTYGVTNGEGANSGGSDSPRSQFDPSSSQIIRSKTAGQSNQGKGNSKKSPSSRQGLSVAAASGGQLGIEKSSQFSVNNPFSAHELFVINEVSEPSRMISSIPRYTALSQIQGDPRGTNTPTSSCVCHQNNLGLQMGSISLSAMNRVQSYILQPNPHPNRKTTINPNDSQFDGVDQLNGNNLLGEGAQFAKMRMTVQDGTNNNDDSKILQIPRIASDIGYYNHNHQKQIRNYQSPLNVSDQEQELEIADESMSGMTNQNRCPMCNQRVLAIIGQRQGLLDNPNIQSQIQEHQQTGQCQAVSGPQLMIKGKLNQNDIQQQGIELKWSRQLDKDGNVQWIQIKAPKQHAINQQSSFYNQKQIKIMTVDQAKKLDIEDKKRWLEIKCDELRISFLQESITLVIDRANILTHSYSQFLSTDGFDFHKEVKIFFVDEVAQDAGGLMREWITELIKMIFNDQTGLFKMQRGQNDASYYINSNAKLIFPDFEHLGYFRFAGSIIGKAMFEKIPISAKLNKFLLKCLTQGSTSCLITLDDLRHFDYDIFNSVSYIVKNPKVEDSTLREFTFTIANEYGEDVELMEGGKNIRVNKQNRDKYGQLVAQYYLKDMIKDEMRAFIEGFQEVIPEYACQAFDNEEMDFLLGGTPFIDIEDWKNNTMYQGDFHERHPVVVWFWEILEKLTQEQLKKFLVFCTGMPRVPIDGFKSLQGNRGQIRKFALQSTAIESKNSGMSIIRAHTCFNRLDVPLFKKKDDLSANIKGILDQESYKFDFD